MYNVFRGPLALQIVYSIRYFETIINRIFHIDCYTQYGAPSLIIIYLEKITTS